MRDKVCHHAFGVIAGEGRLSIVVCDSLSASCSTLEPGRTLDPDGDKNWLKLVDKVFWMNDKEEQIQ